jgi:hypothetical protein
VVSAVRWSSLIAREAAGRLRLVPQWYGLPQAFVAGAGQDVADVAAVAGCGLDQTAVGHSFQVAHERGPFARDSIGELGDGGSSGDGDPSYMVVAW